MATKAKPAGYYQRMRQMEYEAVNRERQIAVGNMILAPQKAAPRTAPTNSRPWWQTADLKGASGAVVNLVFISLALELRTAIKAEKDDTARYFRLKRLQSQVKAQIKK